MQLPGQEVAAPFLAFKPMPKESRFGTCHFQVPISAAKIVGIVVIILKTELWTVTCVQMVMAQDSVQSLASGLSVYQHDGPAVFRFEVTGLLDGSVVEELEHAWITAASVLAGKELVLDISALTGSDDAGIRLLARMRTAGARIIPPARLDSPELARALGLQVKRQEAALPRSRWRKFAERFLAVCPESRQ